MKVITDQLEKDVRSLLGLGPAKGPLDIELMACTLRRAAAFRCPCPARTLLEDAERALDGLLPESQPLRDALEEVLESLVIFGDLVEGGADEDSDQNSRLLYGAPLSYVRHDSGIFFLLGTFVDGVAPFTEELRQLLLHRGHLCTITVPAGRDREFAEELRACGYHETALAQWLRTPNTEPASAWKHRYDTLLDRAPACVDLPGLQLLDPAGNRRYYRGRWVNPGHRSGRFVGLCGDEPRGTGQIR
jgi:hypothetical protein